MTVEAIVAIEELTDGIGTKDGKLLLENKLDKARFVEKTKGKIMVCGRKTYETLPKGMETRYGRKIHIVTRNNLIETKDMLQCYLERFIIIGGGQTYRTFEDLVDTWYITWFYSPIDNVTYNNLVRYRPNLKKNYYITEEEFPEVRMRFATYKGVWNR